jgi:hypothetical protein
VCPDSFTDMYARVTCEQLGYPRDDKARFSVVVNSTVNASGAKADLVASGQLLPLTCHCCGRCDRNDDPLTPSSSSSSSCSYSYSSYSYSYSSSSFSSVNAITAHLRIRVCCRADIWLLLCVIRAWTAVIARHLHVQGVRQRRLHRGALPAAARRHPSRLLLDTVPQR